jgi:phosphate-selective porin
MPHRIVHRRFILTGQRLYASATRGLPMMTISSRAVATALVSLMLATSAFAQTAATPAPAAPATSAAPAKAKPERTAASLECSKQADEKGLKGKDRKKFRSQCKRDAGKTDAMKPDTTKAK